MKNGGIERMLGEAFLPQFGWIVMMYALGAGKNTRAVQ